MSEWLMTADNAEAATSPCRARYLPLVVAVVYLTVTFLLAIMNAGAPATPEFPYSLQVPWRLTAFVSIAYLFLAVGFVSGMRKHINSLGPATRWSGSLKYVKLLLLFGCCSMCIGCVGRLLHGGYELTPRLLFELQPGAAYRAIHSDALKSEKSSTIRIANATNVATVAAMSLGGLFWTRLSLRYKSILAIGLAAHAVGFAAIGTNKGLAEVLIYVVTARMIAMCGNWQETYHRLVPRSLAAASFCAAVFTGLFVFAFAQIMADRASEAYVASFAATPTGRIVGAKIAFTCHLLAHYCSQGYWGLSYHLIDPFPATGGWTYGFGNSLAAMAYLDRLCAIDLMPYHYMHIVEHKYGYPMDLTWSTVFPWLASDFTFPGCIVFMLFVGRFGARCWHEATAQCRVSSALILGQIGMFVAYIPANNQLVQGAPGLTAFVMLSAWWLYDHTIRSQTRLRQKERN